MGNDMRPLAVELPEDIMKAKWCGDFDRALRLIEMQLKNEKCPKFLKERLLLEKEIIARLPVDYIYPEEEALALVKKSIPDFSKEEFDSLVDSSAIDWIYVNGKLTASRRFFETLCAVHPDIAKRAGIDTAKKDEERELLKKTAAEMKETGGASYHIKMKAKLKIADEIFRAGEKVKVYLPVPTECMNMQNVKILSGSHEIKKLSDGSTGARTVMFEETPEKNEEFFVEYEYDSVVKYTSPEPEKASDEQPDFDIEELYPHIRFTPTIIALRDELAAGETNPVVLARRFFDYCTKVVTYSYMREYFCLTEIPEYVALGRKGDCGVQALLFITLCRSAGIPARWQSGLFVTPYSVGSHDWAQFYIAPYGWMFADPSFGGSGFRNGDMERQAHYFGNLDPFRMAANSAYQAQFDPPIDHLRIDPYDNQKGEVDYEDRALRFGEFEADYDVEEINKL